MSWVCWVACSMWRTTFLFRSSISTLTSGRVCPGAALLPDEAPSGWVTWVPFCMTSVCRAKSSTTFLTSCCSLGHFRQELAGLRDSKLTTFQLFHHLGVRQVAKLRESVSSIMHVCEIRWGDNACSVIASWNSCLNWSSLFSRLPLLLASRLWCSARNLVMLWIVFSSGPCDWASLYSCSSPGSYLRGVPLRGLAFAATRRCCAVRLVLGLSSMTWWISSPLSRSDTSSYHSWFLIRASRFARLAVHWSNLIWHSLRVSPLTLILSSVVMILCMNSRTRCIVTHSSTLLTLVERASWPSRRSLMSRRASTPSTRLFSISRLCWTELTFTHSPKPRCFAGACTGVLLIWSMHWILFQPNRVVKRVSLSLGLDSLESCTKVSHLTTTFFARPVGCPPAGDSLEVSTTSCPKSSLQSQSKEGLWYSPPLCPGG